MFDPGFFSRQYFPPVWFAPAMEGDEVESDLPRTSGGDGTDHVEAHAVQKPQEPSLSDIILADDDEVITIAAQLLRLVL